MNKKDNKYDLSIGLIVKNEEKYLEQCLKALLPLKELISCEIIVTDTGSTDKTVEIAEKYADTVLHFEWCDDFAAARNTGVEAVQGDWFMFIDADEIFDDSVVNIAEFIKSDDRDSYDCASIIIRNFKDDKLEKYNELRIKRLLNFTKGNRLFEGKIHEFIPYIDISFNLNSTILHYGYIPQVMMKKKTRNQVLLEKEYEESPNDIKVIIHLLDCVENNYKIVLSKRAMDVIDRGVDNNFKDIKNPRFIFSVFCSLAAHYMKMTQNELVIETCERYFNTKFIQLYNTKPCYPTLEIHFILAYAYFKTKQYDKSLENFLKYQKMYEDLNLNHNSFLESAHQYSFNSELEYEKSGNFIMDIYIINGNMENYDKYLTKSNLYKYFLYDEILINIYIQKIISFDRKDLFEKTMSYFKENDIEENCDKMECILISKIYFENDLSYFINNFSTSNLNRVLIWGNKNVSKIKNVFYDILSKDIEVNDLKELKVYIQVAYFYLISEIDSLSKKSVNLEFRKKIDDIFNVYIESMIYYLNELYTPVMLQNQNLDILAKEEAMCVVLSLGFENRDNDRISYIKSLKEALKYDETFKYIILNSICVIEDEISKVEAQPEDNAESTDKEFELLALKIKQSISSLILSKELEQAKAVLEQYKSINPTDPDIDKFIKLMI